MLKNNDCSCFQMPRYCTFIMLINAKMSTSKDILTFMSKINCCYQLFTEGGGGSVSTTLRPFKGLAEVGPSIPNLDPRMISVYINTDT